MTDRERRRLVAMIDAYGEDVFIAATHPDVSTRVDRGAIGSMQFEAIIKYVERLTSRRPPFADPTEEQKP